MRATRSFGLVTLLLVAFGTLAAPAGAVSAVQTCSGPSSVVQAGSASVSPGLNARPDPQTITLTVHLFSCSPTRHTSGAGTLNVTFTTPTANTCALIKEPHVLKPKATIVWKNKATSTVALTMSFTGSTRLVNLSGKVTAGVFATHAVSGQYHYTPVVSPHGHTVTEACANSVAPGSAGRIKIAGLTFIRTKHLIIT